MANLSQEQLRRLARLGAMARLEQLRQEEAAIRGEFPELFGRGRQAQAGDVEGGRHHVRHAPLVAQLEPVLADARFSPVGLRGHGHMVSPGRPRPRRTR